MYIGKNISNREIYLNGEWSVYYTVGFIVPHMVNYFYTPFKYTSISFCLYPIFTNLYTDTRPTKGVCCPSKSKVLKVLTPFLFARVR